MPASAHTTTPADGVRRAERHPAGLPLGEAGPAQTGRPPHPTPDSRVAKAERPPFARRQPALEGSPKPPLLPPLGTRLTFPPAPPMAAGPPPPAQARRGSVTEEGPPARPPPQGSAGARAPRPVGRPLRRAAGGGRAGGECAAGLGLPGERLSPSRVPTPSAACGAPCPELCP